MAYHHTLNTCTESIGFDQYEPSVGGSYGTKEKWLITVRNQDCF